MIFSSCLRRLGQYGSTPPSFSFSPSPSSSHPLSPPPLSPPYSMDSIKNIHGIRGSWFLGKLFFGVLWEIKVRDFPTVECFRAVFDYIPWSEKMIASDLRCPDTSLRPCEISRRSVFQDCSRFGSKSVTNPWDIHGISWDFPSHTKIRTRPEGKSGLRPGTNASQKAY